MCKRIVLLITVSFISFSSVICAQESDSIFSQLESGSLSLKNPFESQLPRKEMPIEIPPQVDPEKIEPSKIEPTCADDIRHCMTLSDCRNHGHYWYNDACNSKPEPADPESIAPPAPVVKRNPPNVSISGIIWNSDRPQAIINGTIVDIGDTISNIKITGIQKEGVEGLFDGRTVTLKP